VQQTQRRWSTALRIVAIALGALLLARIFAAADLERVTELLGGIGLAGVVAILLPQISALSVESYGWKLTFEALGREVRWAALLRVRMATEALAQSLPVGVAFAESIKPLLLRRHCNLDVAPAVAGMAARKYLLLLSQSAYVLGLAAVGFNTLEAASPGLIGRSGLGYLACLSGGVLGLLAVGIALSLKKSNVARSIFGLLRRIPSARLRARLEQRERGFAATDHALSAFFQADFRRTVRPALFFGAGWFLESVETYLILRVLGVDVDFFTIASFEVVLSLIRNIVFVVPAGLGIQDLGYVACLTVIGVPDPANGGAAFVLAKRSKELFWIAMGYGCLLGSRSLAARRPFGGVREHSHHVRVFIPSAAAVIRGVSEHHDSAVAAVRVLDHHAGIRRLASRAGSDQGGSLVDEDRADLDELTRCHVERREEARPNRVAGHRQRVRRGD
jgi:uncharacterized membrane protein YbhN (UPF0104 family)